ncbi:CCA tRNA nucleotidyltransferase [Jannaschia helgolandensis]|uniref:CCA tRNA nucleotidyltransferase n=1 Tax=Jannaschia helgolandensis TaxID=188906 RepID=UPI0030DB1965
MRITDDWLTASRTQAVFTALNDAGYRALAVGGCVRNALLGVPVSDIDLATNATPDRVMDVAEAVGFKVVPTGIDHGTVTVISDGTPYEITTFRRDIDTDGRYATVAFSDDVTEDAARRDFTMNALYADASGVIVDPLGGLDDLRARHVRFIGDPVARITEDYLRILRFFRFTAWYGDPALGLDADGLAACADHSEGLARLSRERVGHEIRKLLGAPDPAPALAAMAQTGILQRVLPGADATALPVLIHLEASPGDWTRRLALLGGDTSGLRLSKKEMREVQNLTDAARSDISPFAMGDIYGRDLAQDAMFVQAALLGQDIDPALLAEARDGAKADFPLSASDLMPGLSGPALGSALEAARTLWRSTRGRATHADLIAAARADRKP